MFCPRIFDKKNWLLHCLTHYCFFAIAANATTLLAAPNQFIAENIVIIRLFGHSFRSLHTLFFEWLFTCPLRCWCVSLFVFFCYFCFFFLYTIIWCVYFILIKICCVLLFRICQSVLICQFFKCLALSRFLTLLHTERERESLLLLLPLLLLLYCMELHI